MPEELQWLASLGVGGVLAGFMFWFYRKDFLKERAEKNEMLTILTKLIEHNTTANIELASSIKALKDSMVFVEESRRVHLEALLERFKKASNE